MMEGVFWQNRDMGCSGNVCRVVCEAWQDCTMGELWRNLVNYKGFCVGVLLQKNYVRLLAFCEVVL